MTQEKPIHVVRLGFIKASIWKNDILNGVRYNATFCRLDKDGDDKWSTTDSFGRDDLPVLSKVVDAAHSWIYEQMQEEKEQKARASTNKDGLISS